MKPVAMFRFRPICLPNENAKKVKWLDHTMFAKARTDIFEEIVFEVVYGNVVWFHFGSPVATVRSNSAEYEPSTARSDRHSSSTVFERTTQPQTNNKGPSGAPVWSYVPGQRRTLLS